AELLGLLFRKLADIFRCTAPSIDLGELAGLTNSFDLSRRLEAGSKHSTNLGVFAGKVLRCNGSCTCGADKADVFSLNDRLEAAELTVEKHDPEADALRRSG